MVVVVSSVIAWGSTSDDSSGSRLVLTPGDERNSVNLLRLCSSAVSMLYTSDS